MSLVLTFSKPLLGLQRRQALATKKQLVKSKKKTNFAESSVSSTLHRLGTLAKPAFSQRHTAPERAWISPLKGRRYARDAKSTMSPRLVKTPSDSYFEKAIALRTDPKLRELFINNWGEVRVGLLLEELDRLAGAVAYKHALDAAKNVVSFLAYTPTSDLLTSETMQVNDKPLPMTIVTASVDSIILYRQLVIQNDLLIRGRVVLVGRSSMEVLLEVDTILVDAASGVTKRERAIEAHFTMVARTPDGLKSVTIPDLQPTTELEQALYKRAQEHRRHRKHSLESSLFNTVPKPEEHELLHRLFYKGSTEHTLTIPPHSPIKDTVATPSAASGSMNDVRGFVSTPQGHDGLSAGSIKMSDTFRSSVFVMQPQKRNIHNKVFGGYLMRLAFEQAWCSAYIFSGSLPSFIACDDIAFLLPVPLGTLVTFDNTVVYSRQIEDGRYEVVVEVKANVLHPASHTQDTTNTFFYFFRVATCDLQVIPWTYQESMKWLDGKRRLEAITTSREMGRSSLSNE